MPRAYHVIGHLALISVTLVCAPVLAQLSFLPIAAREGLSGNSSVARSTSSLAPLANPATAAKSIFLGEDEATSVSVSSNIYAISNVDTRGGEESGNIRSDFSSIPTSFSGQRRIGGMSLTYGIYQTERFRADYRFENPQIYLGRTTATLDINRVAVALGRVIENFRFGLGICVSNLQLKLNSQAYSSQLSNIGATTSFWEERSRTDLTGSIGFVYDVNAELSLGASVRSPSVALIESVDGQRFIATVANTANTSTLSHSGVDRVNEIGQSGLEGQVGFSYRDGTQMMSAELALFESPGQAIGGMGGEVVLRLGNESSLSEDSALLVGLSLGLADVTGKDIYPNRKAIPFTASAGLEMLFGDSKKIIAGLFHNNSLDWEIETPGQTSYGVLQRTGIVLSGQLAL